MKLLIVTQKVDMEDPILGFFHKWIAEFATRFDSVLVICLYQGKYDLPANVRVLSLGKEANGNKLSFILKFRKYIKQEKDNYDAVFVHMNPIYMVLGGLFWKMNNKATGLWYTHRNVDLKLRVATMLVDRVFTASKESFRIRTRKARVVGHGIDVGSFSVPRAKEVGIRPLQIIHIGRITPIKNCHVLVKAVSILKKTTGVDFKLAFVGGPATPDDRRYLEYVTEEVSSNDLRGEVVFMGDVAPRNVPGILAMTDISVNLTPTGGVDKSVLESMAAGVPVFSSNKAFEDYFGKLAPRLIFEEGNHEDLALKMKSLITSGELAIVGSELKSIVTTRSGLKNLIESISSNLKQK